MENKFLEKLGASETIELPLTIEEQHLMLQLIDELVATNKEWEEVCYGMEELFDEAKESVLGYNTIALVAIIESIIIFGLSILLWLMA